MVVINSIFILLKLPFLFLQWWFLEAPVKLLLFLVRYFFHLAQVFSLPILLKTFFVPWKNETQEGYVAIARGVGMAVKTMVILADLVVLLIFFLVGITIFFFWVGLPLFAGYLIIYPWT